MAKLAAGPGSDKSGDAKRTATGGERGFFSADERRRLARVRRALRVFSTSGAVGDIQGLEIVSGLLDVAAIIVRANCADRPTMPAAMFARVLDELADRASGAALWSQSLDRRLDAREGPGGPLAPAIAHIDSWLAAHEHDRGVGYRAIDERDFKRLSEILALAARRSAPMETRRSEPGRRALAHTMISTVARVRPDLCTESQVDERAGRLVQKLEKLGERVSSDEAVAKAALRACGVPTRKADALFDHRRSKDYRTDNEPKR